MHSTHRCSVDECDRSDIQGRGLCRMHYFRWYRTGSTDVRRPQRPSRGTCTIEGCEKADAGSHGLCPMHHTRDKRNGSPTALRGPKVSRGADNWNWTGDDVTYHAQHLRLKSTRGPASNYKCTGCGDTAAQWAYDNADPSARTSKWGMYSVDIEHYKPMCIPCHKKADLEVAGHPTRGEGNLFAKLTDSDVRDIRRLAASGLSQEKIGRRYGVTQSTVWRVLHGRTWTHVQ